MYVFSDVEYDLEKYIVTKDQKIMTTAEYENVQAPTVKTQKTVQKKKKVNIDFSNSNQF